VLLNERLLLVNYAGDELVKARQSISVRKLLSSARFYVLGHSVPIYRVIMSAKRVSVNKIKQLCDAGEEC
jgi:hypothetical protein